MNKNIIKHVFNALLYSIDGVKAIWEHELSFRLLTLLSICSITLALFSPFSGSNKAFLIACSILILIIELFNSAVEAVVDYISLDIHPLAKRAKDMCSAAQMFGLINLGAIWLMFFLEHKGLFA